MIRWFDGVDVRHRFIDGFRFDGSKNFVTIHWGSPSSRSNHGDHRAALPPLC
jgi:hypothetical protein